ncbi:hypothetical protein NIES4106_31560 [Fischerella sp. NIES-4106]|nr:hypothetical protein NIES4106_31560 [Fischerella sp. NIES-4106]
MTSTVLVTFRLSDRLRIWQVIAFLVENIYTLVLHKPPVNTLSTVYPKLK